MEGRLAPPAADPLRPRDVALSIIPDALQCHSFISHVDTLIHGCSICDYAVSDDCPSGMSRFLMSLTYPPVPTPKSWILFEH